MFELNRITPIAQDEKAQFDIILDKEYTLGKFLRTILMRSEWGHIGINNNLYMFKYKNEKLLSEWPINLNNKVLKVTARGGWSRMDYNIIIE